jgi:hypothetical protein
LIPWLRTIWAKMRKDPILLGLGVLIFLSLIPMPFLGYRLLNRGGDPSPTATVVVRPVMPTATSTPTPPPTSTPMPTSTPTPTPTPTPTVVQAPLSGFEVGPEAFAWPPIAVMIPSDSEQYGLSLASIVYEAAAEHNIPRFMAIFEQVTAEKIGPIRSARPYFVEWACPLGPLYVHWGGSPQAYRLLGELDCLYHIDGQVYEGSYFWRAEIVDIPWNNGFSSSGLMYEYLENWELPRFVDVVGYGHKTEALSDTRPLTGTISFSFSYAVRYTYDPEGNEYLREYKGRPHVDMLTGEQHRVKNVVIIFVPQEPIPDDPKGRMEFETTGEGEALLFLDGVLIEGTWEKAAQDEEIRFLDDEGEEILFNRGNIWIEVLPPDQQVSIDLGEPPE